MWPSWLKNWLIWSFIGVCFLFFGGLAAHGYRRLLPAESAVKPLDWEGLFQLSIGGGIVVGLLGLALTLASRGAIGWGLGLGAVGLLLFLIFVWPTPYKYYREALNGKEGRLIRVHRLTGSGYYVVP